MLVAQWHFSFHSISLVSHFVHFTLLFTKNNKLWNERKEEFLCIDIDFVFFVFVLYFKGVGNRIFRHNRILNTNVCIKNPYWESSGIMIFLCKYYIHISDTVWAILAVISSEFHEKPTRKDWVTPILRKKMQHWYFMTSLYIWPFYDPDIHILAQNLSQNSVSISQASQNIPKTSKLP